MSIEDLKKTQPLDPIQLILVQLQSMESKLDRQGDDIRNMGEEIRGIRNANSTLANQVADLSTKVERHASRLDELDKQIARTNDSVAKAHQSAGEIHVKLEDFQKAVLFQFETVTNGMRRDIFTIQQNDETQNASLSRLEHFAATALTNAQQQSQNLAKLSRWSQHPSLKIIGAILGAAIASYLAARAH